MTENQLDNEGMPREIWVRPKKFPMNEADIPTGDWFIDYNLPRGHGPIWKYRIAGPAPSQDDLVKRLVSLKSSRDETKDCLSTEYMDGWEDAIDACISEITKEDKS